MLNNGLPNVPFKVPITDDQGLVSPTWAAWFRQAFVRMGGNLSLSNSDLTGTAITKTDSLAASVASLQTTVNALTSGTALGLNQGPTL